MAEMRASFEMPTFVELGSLHEFTLQAGGKQASVPDSTGFSPPGKSGTQADGSQFSGNVVNVSP